MSNEEYNEKNLFPPILAVDFDGTLVDNKFPEIGAIKPDIWAAVRAYKLMGWKIVLWSCRNGTMLDDAVKFCADNGLEFDAVNQNIPEVIQYFGADTRKVFANLYWDDRSAVLVSDPPGSCGRVSSLEPMPLAMDFGVR